MNLSSPSPDISMTQSLVSQVFERLMGDSALTFDLYQGTVHSLSGVRIIYLSTDIIQGIHSALHFEAGDSWRLILKTAGYVWGKRVAQSLDRELSAIAGKKLEKLTVDEYVALLENYFSMNGWGKMTITLDDAQSHGIIVARLEHSIFGAALSSVPGNVDEMIAGMLRGMFENISGQELDCIEMPHPPDGMKDVAAFIVTAPKRIQGLSNLVDQKATFNEFLDELRAGK